MADFGRRVCRGEKRGRNRMALRRESVSIQIATSASAGRLSGQRNRLLSSSPFSLEQCTVKSTGDRREEGATEGNLASR